MALCPFARHRLIPKHNRVGMAVYKRVTCHQAVSGAESLYGFFSGAAVCSHFYINQTGIIDQYIDTRYQSAADYNGNDASISIETWDAGGNVSQWNGQQLDSLVRLFIWITDTHREIPRKLATDSLVGESGKGLSWHRLGVDSYPTLYKPGWRQPGGVLFSKSRGKVCPGDGRIAQLPGVMAEVHRRTSGGGPAPVPPKPVPVPEPPKLKEEEDMLFRNRENGEVIYVSGGKASPVYGDGSYDEMVKFLPVVNVSPGQIALFKQIFV